MSKFSNFITTNVKDFNFTLKSLLKKGNYEMGILHYKQMRQMGIKHDNYTLPILNQLYYNMYECDVNHVIYGQMIYSVAIRTGFNTNAYFGNTQMRLYFKCGCFSIARKVFDEMPERDVVSWTELISGLAYEHNGSSSFMLFSDMRREVTPNFVTFITMLKACSSFGDVCLGAQFHGCLLKFGCLNDLSVRNTLLQMYADVGIAENVVRLFYESGVCDVVTYNIMISFRLSSNDFDGVIECFRDMFGEVAPSLETLTFISSTLIKFGSFSQGQQLHCFVTKSGLYDDILLTCLMDLYAKFGHLNSSVILFSEIKSHNDVSLSTLMCGFIENGHYNKAFNLFRHLYTNRIEPPTIDVIKNIIDACSHTGVLCRGKEIHGYYIRNFMCNSSKNSSISQTSILNMYIRCGSITSAKHCFTAMVTKDVIAWTSMIEGLGTYGLGHEALYHFNQMLNDGFTPNAVTLLSLLSACSHAGLTIEGCELLYKMKWKLGIEPELNHYTCIVDLLGRSGRLKEGLALILKNVVYPDSRIWGALLSASRLYMDRSIGEYAVKRILELEPDNIGYHIVFSNMRASVEQWSEVEEIRMKVIETNTKKVPGWSCIEVNGRIQGFVSGDRDQLHVEKVYEMIGCLSRQMKDLDLYSFGVMIE